MAWPSPLKSSETRHCAVGGVRRDHGGAADLGALDDRPGRAGTSTVPSWSQDGDVRRSACPGWPRRLLASAAEQVSASYSADGLLVLRRVDAGRRGGRDGRVRRGRRSAPAAVGRGRRGRRASGPAPQPLRRGRAGRRRGRRRGRPRASPDGPRRRTGWRCRTACRPGSARPGPLAITGRNRSCAVWPSSLGLVAVLPGHRDHDGRSPSVTTSASATPSALTRCSMICRAWSSASRLGGLPSAVRACSVTVVPPQVEARASGSPSRR